MSKQKQNYSVARIRPTSYSHIKTKQQQSENKDQKSGLFFSNLLHNYQKVNKRDQPKLKHTFLHIRKGNSDKIRAIEVELKQNQRKILLQSPIFTSRPNFQSENQRLSNYSLYLQRSISKKSRRNSQRFFISNRKSSEMSKSQLLEPCKITPIKIQTRKIQSEIIKENKQSAEIIRNRNKRGRFNVKSQLNFSKKFGEQLIEPWSLKNYQSIVI